MITSYSKYLKEMKEWFRHRVNIGEDAQLPADADMFSAKMYIANLEAENAELKARLERAIELPYVKRDCELTQIIYKNSYGDIEEETYFHDCYYGERHDVRGDVYAEVRLAELNGGEKNG